MNRTKLHQALEAMESNWDSMEWYSFSSRDLPKRIFVQAEKLGLAKSGMCQICDDDGWSLPDRQERMGWTITELGRMWLYAAERTVFGGLNNRALYQEAKELLDAENHP